MKRLPIRRMRWLKKHEDDIAMLARDVFGFIGVCFFLLHIVRLLFSQ